MTRSLQLIDPTLVAFVRSLEIILAYLVQVFWMQQYPQITSIIGSSLVVFCVICTSLQSKFMSILPEKIKFLFWNSYIWSADWHGTAGQFPWLCMYSNCSGKLRSPDTKITVTLLEVCSYIRNCSVKIGVNWRHGGHQCAEKYKTKAFLSCKFAWLYRPPFLSISAPGWSNFWTILEFWSIFCLKWRCNVLIS